jgi:hypothetical protein
MVMKRVWAQVSAAASLLAGSAICFSACVHDDSTIFIRNVLAPKYAQTGSVCVWQADPTQAVITSGTLDVALSVGYEAVFLIGNQLVPQVNANQMQTETSTVKIDGAVVRITNAAGVELAKYTRLSGTTISPSSGGVPGYGVDFLTIVDPGTILNVNDPNLGGNTIHNYLGSLPLRNAEVRLVTYVRFFGKTLGGQSVESNEFEFPVDVCDGCLIGYTNNPMYATPNCVGNAAAGSSSSMPQVPCFFGQDLGVDCNLCQDRTECRGAFLGSPDAGGG